MSTPVTSPAIAAIENEILKLESQLHSLRSARDVLSGGPAPTITPVTPVQQVLPIPFTNRQQDGRLHKTPLALVWETIHQNYSPTQGFSAAMLANLVCARSPRYAFTVKGALKALQRLEKEGKVRRESMARGALWHRNVTTA